MEASCEKTPHTHKLNRGELHCHKVSHKKRTADVRHKVLCLMKRTNQISQSCWAEQYQWQSLKKIIENEWSTLPTANPSLKIKLGTVYDGQIEGKILRTMQAYEICKTSSV